MAYCGRFGRLPSGGHSLGRKHTPRKNGRRLAVERLEERTLLSVHLTAEWLSQQGPGPYILSASNTTYVLDTDVSTPGTAFILGGQNISLDLNGHTVTYGNASPISVANGGFEQGSGRDVPGWDLTAAPSAALADNTQYLWGNKILTLTNLTGTETILSDPIAIFSTNREYAATITPKGPWDATVRLSVIDATTGTVLGAATASHADRAFSAVVQFTPATTNPVRLKVDVSPAAGQTATVSLDYASLGTSRDYGIVATKAWYYLPSQLQTASVVSACQAATNATISNGSIVQGQGSGFSSLPVYGKSFIGLTVDHVQTLSSGIDTGAVDATWSSNITVRDSIFRSTVDKITNRMTMVGAMILLARTNGSVLVQGNTLLDSPQIGINASQTIGLVIDGNTIQSNTIVSDGYGVLLNGVHNFQVSANTITAGTGKSGRGILLDGVSGLPDPTSDHGEIFGNYVDIREHPNPEYGTGGLEATALRLRTYYDAGQRDIHIHDNTFIARTGPGDVHAAIGTRVSYPSNSSGNDLNVLVENNFFKAIVETSDPTYWARAVSLENVGVHCSPLFQNNTFESNDTSLGLGGNDGIDAYAGTFISNTIRKSSEGAARAYHSVSAGYWIGEVHNVQIIDPRYENGATPAIFWDGSGTKDLSTGWLLDVQVSNAFGTLLAGAIVQVLDKDGVAVFSGTTDADGRMSAIPVVTTIYRQTGTNPNAITTEPRGPFHVQVSLTGYTPVGQIVTINQTMRLSLELVPVNEEWTGASGANDWGAIANWTPVGAPNQQGVEVSFGAAGSTGTVDLTTSHYTVGRMVFAVYVSTTIAGTGGKTLTLDNGPAMSTIDVAGSHRIEVPVVLNSDLTVTTSDNADSLVLVGGLSGGASMTKDGSGTLIFGGSNAYTGGTNVVDGTLQVVASDAIPPATSLSIGSNGVVVLDSGLTAGAMSAPADLPPGGTIAGVAARAVAAGSSTGPVSVKVGPAALWEQATQATMGGKARSAAASIAAAHDAVLQAGGSRPAWHDVYWLAGLQQSPPRPQQTNKGDPAQRATEEILAQFS